MSEYLTPFNVLVGLGAYLFLCGLAGCYVSTEKARSPWEGCLLAVLFGPLGLVVAACLPAGTEDAAADDRGDDEDGRARAHLAELERAGPPPVPRARKLLGDVWE